MTMPNIDELDPENVEDLSQLLGIAKAALEKAEETSYEGSFSTHLEGASRDVSVAYNSLNESINNIEEL